MQFEQLTTSSGLLMQGPLLITPQAFGDDRGWFYESWNQRKFDDAVGESVLFSQDNHSRSIQGVLRGLHYQLAPEPQAKLVRATVGAIYDVAVDIRRDSPTFGAWVGAELSAENKSSFGSPKASPTASSPSAMLLRCNTRHEGSGTNPASGPSSGMTPDLAIAWPLDRLQGAEVSLSGKDAEAASFKAAEAAGDVFP